MPPWTGIAVIKRRIPDHIPRYYSTGQVAAVLGRSKQAVRNWIREGQLKAFQPYGDADDPKNPPRGPYCINPDDFEAFLAKRPREAGRAALMAKEKRGG